MTAPELEKSQCRPLFDFEKPEAHRKRESPSHFDHRSLRRMFVTRALQKGVDVKTVSSWQGHRDGGRLILSTYSHVLNEHSAKMVELLNLD